MMRMCYQYFLNGIYVGDSLLIITVCFNCLCVGVNPCVLDNLKTMPRKLIPMWLTVSILIYVHLAVVTSSPHSFEWLPTNKTVQGMYKTDILMMWKYETQQYVDEIIITSSKDNTKEEYTVASWTPNGGSQRHDPLSSDVILEHRKEGDVGTITLTISNADSVLFDKSYYCQLSFQGYKLNPTESKALQKIYMKYRPKQDTVKGRPGQDINLVWIFQYPLPVKYLELYNNRPEKEKTFIMEKDFGDNYTYVEKNYTDRLNISIMQHKDQWEITLTITNTTIDDYNLTYGCRAAVQGGVYKKSHIFLQFDDTDLDEDADRSTPVCGASGLPLTVVYLSLILYFIAGILFS